jgi:SAM-dependent MidA family methyltransferase
VGGVAPFRPWGRAWHEALLGSNGFYTRGPGSLAADGPAGHFRTSAAVDQGQTLAVGILTVLNDVNARLGSSDRVDVVEIGSGEGTLADALTAAIADSSELARRVHVACIDVHDRPIGLRPDITWITGTAGDVLRDADPIHGLILAHEWLDTIACEILEVDVQGNLRVVLVNQDGTELLGPPLDDMSECARIGVDSAAVTDWITHWWPGDRLPGDRIEVGIERDNAMRALTKGLRAGTILAVDYAHDVRSRRRTLAGYRNGRLVTAIPDGSCDITAHVALDSCAHAAEETARAMGCTVRSTTRTQREVFDPVAAHVQWPDPENAVSNPQDYAASLEHMSNAAELRGRGLGDFAWLQIDIDHPRHP